MIIVAASTQLSERSAGMCGFSEASICVMNFLYTYFTPTA